MTSIESVWNSHFLAWKQAHSRVTYRVYVTYIVYRYTYFDEKNIVSHESQVKKLLAVASRLGRSESNMLAGCLNIKTGRKGRNKGFFNNSSVAHTRTLYTRPCIHTFLFSLYNVYKAKNEKPYLSFFYIIYILSFFSFLFCTLFAAASGSVVTIRGALASFDITITPTEFTIPCQRDLVHKRKTLWYTTVDRSRLPIF